MVNLESIDKKGKNCHLGYRKKFNKTKCVPYLRSAIKIKLFFNSLNLRFSVNQKQLGELAHL